MIQHDQRVMFVLNRPTRKGLDRAAKLSIPGRNRTIQFARQFTRSGV